MNRYHPGGDPKNPPKDAPSALHSVIIPNVNLPKVRNTILLLSVVNANWVSGGNGEDTGVQVQSRVRDEQELVCPEMLNLVE